MVAYVYNKLAPYLAGFFAFTTVVMFAMCVWRGEIILGLQADLLKNKDQNLRVVVEQQEVAIKISGDYEDRKSDKIQEKIYVDRQVEKIVSVPTYSNECIDSVGMHFLNSQIQSLNGTSQSQSGLSTNTGAK